MRNKNNYLIILLIAALFGCLGIINENTDSTKAGSTLVSATPVGEWAGLEYQDQGWVLEVFEGFEKRWHPMLYAYSDGQEILVNPYIKDCELSYWYGGADGYDEEEWDFLITYLWAGKNKFEVVTWVLYGQVVGVNYIYIPENESESNLSYLGSLRLRFGGEIQRCVEVAEELLATLSIEGLSVQREIHIDWMLTQRSGGN